MKQSFTCAHEKRNVNNLIKIPTKSEIKDFSILTDYFLYCAPFLDSSPHSTKMDVEKQKEVFDKLIADSSMGTNWKFYTKLKDTHFAKMGLDGDKICMKCPRMICRRACGEVELQTLLRHIRNAIAHGYIYVQKEPNQIYILFKDYGRRNNSGNCPLTAKIVTTRATLEKWKKTLEQYCL